MVNTLKLPHAPLCAGALLLAACATSAPAGGALAGDWQVHAISGQGIVEGSAVTLAFSDTGQFSGNSSCNSFGGSYTVRSDQIEISRPVSTLRACAPALMEQEGRLYQFLEQVKTYRINEDGQLILSTETGETLNAHRMAA